MLININTICMIINKVDVCIGKYRKNFGYDNNLLKKNKKSRLQHIVDGILAFSY